MMRGNYKPIGDYVKQVKLKNKDNSLSVEHLRGIRINKEFMPSVANVTGTDLSKYRVVKQYQFAYNPMHVGRDEVLPISMLTDEEAIIVSPAYVIFEVTDTSELLPEYLMIWCRRSEFDRNAWFTTDSSVRGGFSWDDFCGLELPVPSIEKQASIVKEYHTITDRIQLNELLNQKLEETAQAIYKEWFEKWQTAQLLEKKDLNYLCALITDGKHGDCTNRFNSGYYFVSIKDLEYGEINYEYARQITQKDFEETDKRTKFTSGDILFTNTGTIGKMIIGKNNLETRRTTFQKSVAILKPEENKSKSYYLYSLLKYYLTDIQELASGTSQANLLLGDFRSFMVMCPNFDEVCKYEKQVTPIFNNLDNKRKENEHLKQLKKVLLSKMAVI